MLEDGVQEADDVAHGLRGKTSLKQRNGHRFHVADLDVGDRPFAQARADVYALDRFDALAVGLARAADLEALP